MRRFAKPLYWLIPVPRVRIPASPPLTRGVGLTSNYCTVPVRESPLCSIHNLYLCFNSLRCMRFTKPPYAAIY